MTDGGIENAWKATISLNDKMFPKWRRDDPRILALYGMAELGECVNDIKHLLGGGTNKTRFAPEVIKKHIKEEYADHIIYSILTWETIGELIGEPLGEKELADEVIKKLEIIRERMHISKE